MTSNQKVALLRELYDVAYAATESFEDDYIGADLAYLMGVILKGRGNRCEWVPDRPIIQLFKVTLGPSHQVWEFINHGLPNAAEPQITEVKEKRR